jgi:hypothetical protein
MNKIEEQQLQKWENDPLRYRNEIEQAERKMSEVFCISLGTGACNYYICKDGSSEHKEAIRHDLDFMRLWNRLTTLVVIITRHDTEVCHAETQKILLRQQTKHKTQIRRVCIRNNGGSLIQTSEVQKMLDLYMENIPLNGKS